MSSRRAGTATAEVGCEHIESPCPLRQEDLARIFEGNCPCCEIPSIGRTDDGFARCGCCGVEWTIGPSWITVRFSYVVVESEDEGSGWIGAQPPDRLGAPHSDSDRVDSGAIEPAGSRRLRPEESQ